MNVCVFNMDLVIVSKSSSKSPQKVDIFERVLDFRFEQLPVQFTVSTWHGMMHGEKQTEMYIHMSASDSV